MIVEPVPPAVIVDGLAEIVLWEAETMSGLTVIEAVWVMVTPSPTAVMTAVPAGLIDLASGNVDSGLLPRPDPAWLAEQVPAANREQRASRMPAGKSRAVRAPPTVPTEKLQTRRKRC